MDRFKSQLCIIAVCMFALCLCSVVARAEEDPAVTRAREIARQQYELEKATRLAEEAKKKLAEQLALQKAIAMTRQGVVSIYNPGTATNGYLPFSYAWKMWDGTLTEWASTTVADKKSLYFYKVGGIKLEVKFTSIAGGEKSYALESFQLPNDVKPRFEDAKPHQFKWMAANKLDLLTGKPPGF